MVCPCCGIDYSDPEEQEHIEKYEMCTKCDKKGEDTEEYEEDY
jgi:hypothetical protein